MRVLNKLQVLFLIMAISACKDSLLSAEEIVANNSIKEYQMAKNSGQPIEICVAAMSVVAAFLQAHDEINYKKWQNIKNQDCKSAGITL